MSSYNEELATLQKEKQEAELVLKKAEAELRVAQQEAEWAKLTLRLAEETLGIQPSIAPAFQPKKLPETKLERAQLVNFSTMTPEAIVKEVQSLGPRADAPTLLAALRAFPQPVEPMGSSVLSQFENCVPGLPAVHVAAAMDLFSDLHIDKMSLWTKLSNRAKGILKSRGRGLKASEICTCVSALTKVGVLDIPLAELYVAQARVIASEFKASELVTTLVALSQLPAYAALQLGEMVEAVSKFAPRLSVSEVAQLLAAVSGLPSAQFLGPSLVAVLKQRAAELTAEDVASALTILGRRVVSSKDVIVEFCALASRVAPEEATPRLAALLTTLAHLGAKHPGLLAVEDVRTFLQQVSKQLVQKIASCDAPSVATALSGLTRLGEANLDAELIEALGNRAVDLVSSLTSRQIIVIVKALVALNKDHPALGALLSHAANPSFTLTPPELAEFVNAVVPLGESSAGGKEICSKAVQSAGWTSGVLLGLLQAMVTLRHPELLARLLADANIKVFDRKEILSSLSTLIALGAEAEPLKQKFMTQIQRDLKFFTPRETVELMNILAKHEPDLAVYQKACEALAAQNLIDFETAEAALRSLTVTKRDHQPLLKKLTTLPVPPNCSAATLTSVFRSLAVFHTRHGPFIQAISAQVLGIVGTLNEHQAADVALAVLSLEHEAPGLIERLVNRLKPGMAAPECWSQLALSLKVEHQDWVIQLPRLGDNNERKLPEPRAMVSAVSAALTRAQFPHRVNVFIEGLPVDIVLDAQGVVVCVADEENCLHFSRQSVGSVLFRNRLLEKLQWKVTRVGYFEWGILRGMAAAEERLLSTLIAAAVPVDPTVTQPPVTVHTKDGAHSDDEDLYYAEDERVL